MLEESTKASFSQRVMGKVHQTGLAGFCLPCLLKSWLGWSSRAGARVCIKEFVLFVLLPGGQRRQVVCWWWISSSLGLVIVSLGFWWLLVSAVQEHGVCLRGAGVLQVMQEP